MKCPNCDKELEDEEMYCYFCETDVSEIQGKKQVPNIFKKKKKKE